MKSYISIVITVIILTCAAIAQPDSARVWPSPPDRARIKHLATLFSGEDFHPKESFLSGIFNVIFGAERAFQWLVQPTGIAISPSGKLYVTDPGAGGIHMFDQKEKEHTFIGETEYGKFVSPVGCAFASDGRVLITDSERKDVIALDEDNDPLFKISDHLVRPTGIQIFGDKVYVTDAGNHTVVVFTTDGKYITEFGHRGSETGEFNFPVQLAARESLYVIDALNYRIQKFDLAGRFGSTFGRQGNVAGRFASPKGIALDSDGDVYITDALMDCIQIFNPAGGLLLVVGKNGSRDGEFMSPGGIAIDGEDKIYVVESLNRRIQIFQYLK